MASSQRHACRPNDIAVQRRTREGAKRPTRPSVCNGRLDGSVHNPCAGCGGHAPAANLLEHAPTSDTSMYPEPIAGRVTALTLNDGEGSNGPCRCVLLRIDLFEPNHREPCTPANSGSDLRADARSDRYAIVETAQPARHAGTRHQGSEPQHRGDHDGTDPSKAT